MFAQKKKLVSKYMSFNLISIKNIYQETFSKKSLRMCVLKFVQFIRGKDFRFSVVHREIIAQQIIN
jgi:hypothetical protein